MKILLIINALLCTTLLHSAEKEPSYKFIKAIGLKGLRCEVIVFIQFINEYLIFTNRKNCSSVISLNSDNPYNIDINLPENPDAIFFYRKNDACYFVVAKEKRLFFFKITPHTLTCVFSITLERSSMFFQGKNNELYSLLKCKRFALEINLSSDEKSIEWGKPIKFDRKKVNYLGIRGGPNSSITDYMTKSCDINTIPQDPQNRSLHQNGILRNAYAFHKISDQLFFGHDGFITIWKHTK